MAHATDLLAGCNKGGKPVLTRQPKVAFIDDGPGKQVGIYRSIGRRRMRLVHHDAAEREFAYDRASHLGTLDKAWDEAKARHWIVVRMKQDWKRIFAFE